MNLGDAMYRMIGRTREGVRLTASAVGMQSQYYAGRTSLKPRNLSATERHRMLDTCSFGNE